MFSEQEFVVYLANNDTDAVMEVNFGSRLKTSGHLNGGMNHNPNPNPRDTLN